MGSCEQIAEPVPSEKKTYPKNLQQGSEILLGSMYHLVTLEGGIYVAMLFDRFQST